MDILFTTYLPDLLAGLWITAQITVVAFLGSLLFGAILAVFRLSPIAPLRIVATVYVEIFRNVPLVALAVLVVFGLPEIGLNPGLLPGIMIATTAVGTAFACETLRTGANAVGTGQIEAARSLGLGFTGIMVNIVLPQAARTVISPLVTLFIGILLSSSIAAVVGVRDLTNTASTINTKESLGLLTFIVVALIYAAISLAAAGVGSALEKRWRFAR